MDYCFLNKNETKNKNLILIFNGWGMNEDAFKHLSSKDCDVLILSDYRKIDINLIDFDLKQYCKKYLIAWSMGVYISGFFKDIIDKFDKKIAINGTQCIIDDNFGIPEKIYDFTIKNFNETSKEKFIENMFKGAKIKPEFTVQRDLKSLKDELISIKNLKPQEKISFDKAVISDFDRIIPPKNQYKYWENKTKILKIKSAHCPFYDYNSFEEILCN